jgi:two-component system chemotaxis response regulator CheY
VTDAKGVLIVDDDPFIRKLIATTLEDVSGFVVHQAGDGVEALQAAAESPPTIVFLDLNMPRMNGIEACRALRAMAPVKQATIVMLTAAGQEEEQRARAAGADLFLTKPFSPLDLLRLVDEIGAA